MYIASQSSASDLPLAAGRRRDGRRTRQVGRKVWAPLAGGGTGARRNSTRAQRVALLARAPLSLSLLARCLSSCVRYSLVVRFIPANDQLPSALALTSSLPPQLRLPSSRFSESLTFVLPHTHPRHAQLLRRPRPHFQLRYVGSSSSLSYSRGPTRSSPRRGCALRSLEVAHPDSR